MSALPKEIRSSIYGIVLAAGDIALTLTSKNFYTDTKEALAEHGACHVKMNQENEYSRYYTITLPPKKHLSKARHLDLEINLDRSHVTSTLPANSRGRSLDSILEYLVPSMKDLKSCSITIAFASIQNLQTLAIRDLDVLRKFESVHMDISMRPQTHRNLYLMKKTSGEVYEMVELAAYLESVLKPRHAPGSGPKLDIIYSLASGKRDPSHVPQSGGKEILAILREQKDGPLNFDHLTYDNPSLVFLLEVYSDYIHELHERLENFQH